MNDTYQRVEGRRNAYNYQEKLAMMGLISSIEKDLEPFYCIL